MIDELPAVLVLAAFVLHLLGERRAVTLPAAPAAGGLAAGR